MSTKQIFTLSDVAAITARMSRKCIPGTASVTLSQGPATAVGAKIMREIGVSREKMNEAYRLAQIAVGLQK